MPTLPVDDDQLYEAAHRNYEWKLRRQPDGAWAVQVPDLDLSIVVPSWENIKPQAEDAIEHRCREYLGAGVPVPQPDDGDLKTPEEVAYQLRLGVQTIRVAIREGRLKAIKKQRSELLISQREVVRWRRNIRTGRKVVKETAQVKASNLFLRGDFESLRLMLNDPTLDQKVRQKIMQYLAHPDAKR